MLPHTLNVWNVNVNTYLHHLHNLHELTKAEAEAEKSADLHFHIHSSHIAESSEMV
jgi:hypothetical protein